MTALEPLEPHTRVVATDSEGHDREGFVLSRRIGDRVEVCFPGIPASQVFPEDAVRKCDPRHLMGTLWYRRISDVGEVRQFPEVVRFSDGRTIEVIEERPDLVGQRLTLRLMQVDYQIVSRVTDSYYKDHVFDVGDDQYTLQIRFLDAPPPTPDRTAT